MIKNISNLGDAALYCDFGKDVNKDTNTKADCQRPRTNVAFFFS